MKYSIIQYITNNYDEIFDCGDMEAAERLLFTDKNTSAKNCPRIVCLTFSILLSNALKSTGT